MEISKFEKKLCERIVTVCKDNDLKDETTVQLKIAAGKSDFSEKLKEKIKNIEVDSDYWTNKTILENNKCWNNQQNNYIKTKVASKNDVNIDYEDRCCLLCEVASQPNAHLSASFDITFEDDDLNALNLLEIKSPKNNKWKELEKEEFIHECYTAPTHSPIIKCDNQYFGTSFGIGSMYVDFVRLLSFAKSSGNSNQNLYFAAIIEKKSLKECEIAKHLFSYITNTPKYFFTIGNCCYNNKIGKCCECNIKGKIYDIWPHPDSEHIIEVYSTSDQCKNFYTKKFVSKTDFSFLTTGNYYSAFLLKIKQSSR